MIIQEAFFLLITLLKVGQCQIMANFANGLQIPSGPKRFPARVPVHLLPSNDIIEYFDWDVETGLDICPFPGMLVRAKRGGLLLPGENWETLEELASVPSPHCSVECECISTGDYRCRSLCAPPPNDKDYCVPVAGESGDCCHRYICDDELERVFPQIQDFPDLKESPWWGNTTTTLMCVPGTLLPDSVCHMFFPRSFSGHRGPKGICFGSADIRCAWLEDNSIPSSAPTFTSSPRQRKKSAMQTMFFRIGAGATMFSSRVPVKRVAINAAAAFV